MRWIPARRYCGAVTTRVLRVAAYAICTRRDEVLLAHWVAQDRTEAHWTLPGGRVEHGEDPVDAVIREVAEETGHDAEVERLLGVDSRVRHVDWAGPDGGELHNIGIFYRLRIVGGELRDEIGGSTDTARWFPLADVGGLERSSLVDIGLNLHREEPGSGHVRPIRVGGLLRH
jgi:8-oxo-dGTP diphosphatase